MIFPLPATAFLGIPTLDTLKWCALVAVLVGTVGYVGGCTHEKAAFDKFKGGVAAAAKAEKDRQAREALARNSITDQREAKHATQIAALTIDRDRLRRNASRSIVPIASQSSKRPDLACFDRTELDTALRSYREEVTGLIGEGTANTIDLDTARGWWQDQQKVAQ